MSIRLRVIVHALALLVPGLVGLEGVASAQAVRSNPGFRNNALPREDDVYTGTPVPIGFPINFFGVTRNSLYVTNNGNVALADDGNLSAYSPVSFSQLSRQVIAPFFADVDTRNPASGTVTFGTDTVNNRPAFGVTWTNVGYFSQKADKLNTFQLVLIDRADTGAAGNFDIEFNYEKIQWEAGDFNGGTNGLGGSSASAGYANGTGAVGTYFELQGSRVPGSFLDSSNNPLRLRTLNSTVPGRLVIEVRGGQIPLRGDCNTPAATIGLSYFGLLASSGGTTPHTWQVQPISGSIPPGLTLRSDGAIQGNPSTIGTYPFTARLTDAATRTVDLACTIVVSPCTQTLTPNPLNVAAGTVDSSFTINMTQPCPWTATSNASWIRLLVSGAPAASRNGNGQATVAIRLEANTGPARSGTITVNGQTITINQNGTGPVTPPSFNPSSAIFSPTGGTGSFQVTSTSAYSATESLDWVTITGGATGAGNGTVSYTVSPYTSGAQSRNGQIFVNGFPFHISQNPPNTPCNYTLTSNSGSFGAAGGRGSTTVNTGDGCGWTMASNVPWITIDSGTAGTTFGLVNYTVAPNTGPARTGTLTIAGNTYTVTQASGADCPTSFLPASATYVAAGTSAATVQLNTPCAWTAASNAGWLSISGPASGSGPGVITFSVAANSSGQARTGQISARGVNFTVTQSAPACTFTLSSRNIILPAGGGSATLNVTAPAGCSWPAFTSPTFGSVSPTSGSGSGAVTISAPANAGAERATGAAIAGQSFTIRQPSQQNISCVAAGPPIVPNIRYSLEAELTGTPTFTCSGSPGANGITADVLVTLNTRITSKLIADKVEALLLIGDPVTPTLGTNAFQGRLAGNNAVRFAGVPIGIANSAAARLFRVVNLRADANTPASNGNDIQATIEINSPDRPVGLTNAQNLVIARRAAPLDITFGTATGSGTVVLPVTYRELLPNTFRAKILPGQTSATLPVAFTSESGYTNSATLGPEIGFADNGFRLQLTLRSIPDGVRVLLDPTVQSGSTRADLIAQDGRGLGVGIQTGPDREAVVVNGQTTITYEISATDPALAETLTFNIRFVAATTATVGAVRTASTAACGPIATGLPANGTLPVPRCSDPGAPPPTYRNVLFAGSLTEAPASLRQAQDGSKRAPGGNVTVLVNAEITCDTTGGCPDSVVRGNFSRGVVVDCQTREGATCEGEGGADVEIQVPNLANGERVATPVSVELLLDDPTSIFLRFRGSSCSGLSCNFGEVERCYTNISGLPAPPSSGVTNGFFELYPCGSWTISSAQPWIRFQVENSGQPFQQSLSGNQVGGVVIIRYTIDPNTTVLRNAAVTISNYPGNINVIQPPAPGPIIGCTPQPITFGQTLSGTLDTTCSSDVRTGSFRKVYEFNGTQNQRVALVMRSATVDSYLYLRSTTGAVLASNDDGGGGGTGLDSRIPAITGYFTLPFTGTYRVDSTSFGSAAQGAFTLQLLLEGGGPPPGGLTFVPITPCRLLETRPIYAGTTWTGQNGPPALAGGVERTLQVTNSRCGIPATARAFVLNITTDTVYGLTGPVDFLTLWPSDEPRPDYWTLRTSTGGYVANSAIVKAGAGGAIKLYSPGSVNLTLDISGYYTSETTGLLFYPTPSCRPIDTRSIPAYTAGLPPPFGNSRMQAQETRTFRLPASTRCQIPAAQAYSMQFTLTPGVEDSGNPVAYLSAWNTGGGEPPVSNLNSLSGYVMSNSAIVPARSDGSIDVKTYNDTNFLADVNGYFGPDDGTGRGLYYFPVTQCRVMNTQDATLPLPFGAPAMSAAADRELTLPNSGRCPGLPASARAWAVNLTAVPSGTPLAFISMWPGGAAWPGVSQLNAFQGQTVSNSAIVPGSASGSIQVKVTNPTHVALEVSGYFSRP